MYELAGFIQTVIISRFGMYVAIVNTHTTRKVTLYFAVLSHTYITVCMEKLHTAKG